MKLQSMKLQKTGHNKFAGYDYFELGDFLPAVQGIFADVGLCVCFDINDKDEYYNVLFNINNFSELFNIILLLL